MLRSYPPFVTHRRGIVPVISGYPPFELGEFAAIDEQGMQ